MIFPARPRGFVLLDVILSIMILSVVALTALRVFHQSLSAVRRSEVMERAAMFAEAKLQEWGLEPPETGARLQGDFSDEPFYSEDLYPDASQYSWEAEVEEEEIDYPHVRLARQDSERMHPLTRVHLRIFHDDGEGGFEPWVAAEVNTYLMGNEQFSFNARDRNGLF